MSYQYRQSVVQELMQHGIKPDDHTPPELAHDFVNDLYRYEIRALRQQLLDGAFPKTEYAPRVLALRQRYPILGLHLRFWTEASAAS
ncbi:MAG: hypothetical protein HY231_19795 [Acidobacteria bacterium]|nr:hypothetical protein [Acidobacteriota bacterium]